MTPLPHGKNRVQRYLHKDGNGQFYTTIQKNGRIIDGSTESYHNRKDALNVFKILAELHGVEWDGKDYIDLSRSAPPKKTTKKK